MLEQALRPQGHDAEAEQILAEHDEQQKAGKGGRADARLAVQGKGALGGDVQEAASRGVSGPGQALPHQDAIQRSFGRFDVSGVTAHTDDNARGAVDQMGAQAYATGDHVAFRGGNPDLHTAAHEAAHVVQQRAGVHLAGGVGREGDPYERHADKVADAVVAGEPAEYLLSQMAGPGAAKGGGAGAVQMKRDLPKGEEGFDKMWEAHPHNYQADESQNTPSEELVSEHGLPDYVTNTCATRLSIMLNSIGETITPAKTKAAGIERKPTYSAKTKQYYIISAKEMWTYLSVYYRKPDITFPPNGKRYKDEAEFQAAFDKDVRPLLAGKKGIVAFDKIFTYSGTGHVDLFDGEGLSDSGTWYPSQRLLLWYVAVS